jgi:tetratricopeptide (TPR) repeat protein
MDEPGSALIAAEWALRASPGSSDALLAKGRALAALEHLELAERCFEEILRSDPENAAAMIRLGEVLLAREKVGPAIKALEKAVGLEPSNLDAWSQLGDALMATGNHKKGFEALRRMVELNPRNEMSWFRMAFEMVEHGAPDVALNCCRQGLELNPDSSMLTHELGFALYRMGRVEEAIPLFRKALEMDPDDRAGSRAMLFLLKGLMEGRTRIHIGDQEIRPASAKPHVEHDPVADSLSSLDSAAVGRLAPDRPAWDHEPDDGFAEMERQQRTPPPPPNGPDEWIRKAEAFVRRRRLDAAILSFRRALELRPGDGASMLKLSWALIADSKLEAASRQAVEAQRLIPEKSGPDTVRARVEQLRSRHDEALRLLDDVQARVPGDPLAARLRVISLYETGRVEEALETLRSIIRTTSGLELHMAEAAVHLKLGRMEEVAAALDRAARAAPRSGAPRWIRACMLLNVGRRAEAIPLLDELVSINPDHKTAILLRAQLLVEQGRNEEALRSFDEVLRRHSRDIQVLPAKVSLLLRLGRQREAEEALRTAGVPRKDWEIYMR